MERNANRDLALTPSAPQEGIDAQSTSRLAPPDFSTQIQYTQARGSALAAIPEAITKMAVTLNELKRDEYTLQQDTERRQREADQKFLMSQTKEMVELDQDHQVFEQETKTRSDLDQTMKEAAANPDASVTEAVRGYLADPTNTNPEQFGGSLYMQKQWQQRFNNISRDALTNALRQDYIAVEAKLTNDMDQCRREAENDINNGMAPDVAMDNILKRLQPQLGKIGWERFRAYCQNTYQALCTYANSKVLNNPDLDPETKAAYIKANSEAFSSKDFYLTMNGKDYQLTLGYDQQGVQSTLNGLYSSAASSNGKEAVAEYRNTFDTNINYDDFQKTGICDFLNKGTAAELQKYFTDSIAEVDNFGISDSNKQKEKARRAAIGTMYVMSKSLLDNMGNVRGGNAGLVSYLGQLQKDLANPNTDWTNYTFQIPLQNGKIVKIAAPPAFSSYLVGAGRNEAMRAAWQNMYEGMATLQKTIQTQGGVDRLTYISPAYSQRMNTTISNTDKYISRNECIAKDEKGRLVVNNHTKAALTAEYRANQQVSGAFGQYGVPSTVIKNTFDRIESYAGSKGKKWEMTSFATVGSALYDAGGAGSVLDWYRKLPASQQGKAQALVVATMCSSNPDVMNNLLRAYDNDEYSAFDSAVTDKKDMEGAVATATSTANIGSGYGKYSDGLQMVAKYSYAAAKKNGMKDKDATEQAKLAVRKIAKSNFISVPGVDGKLLLSSGAMYNQDRDKLERGIQDTTNRINAAFRKSKVSANAQWTVNDDGNLTLQVSGYEVPPNTVNALFKATRQGAGIDYKRAIEVVTSAVPIQYLANNREARQKYVDEVYQQYQLSRQAGKPMAFVGVVPGTVGHVKSNAEFNQKATQRIMALNDTFSDPDLVEKYIQHRNSKALMVETATNITRNLNSQNYIIPVAGVLKGVQDTVTDKLRTQQSEVGKAVRRVQQGIGVGYATDIDNIDYSKLSEEDAEVINYCMQEASYAGKVNQNDVNATASMVATGQDQYLDQYSVSEGAGYQIDNVYNPGSVVTGEVPVVYSEDVPVNMIQAGNIDIHNRPIVENPDGTYSTVKSMIVGLKEKGQEIQVVIPTVSEDGRIMSEKEAIAEYEKTGKHLGKFTDVESAEAFAQELHLEQEQEYASRRETEGGVATGGAAAVNYSRTSSGARKYSKAEIKNNLIPQYAAKHGVPVDLMTNLIRQESGFNQEATSPVGARGLGQFMPATAKSYGVSDLTNAHTSLDAAARHLAGLLRHYGGDQASALAAYNAGAGAVDDYLFGTNKTGNNPRKRRTPHGIPPYKETQNYVKAILGGTYSGVYTMDYGLKNNGYKFLDADTGMLSYKGVNDFVYMLQNATGFKGNVQQIETNRPELLQNKSEYADFAKFRSMKASNGKPLFVRGNVDGFRVKINKADTPNGLNYLSRESIVRDMTNTQSSLLAPVRDDEAAGLFDTFYDRYNQMNEDGTFGLAGLTGDEYEEYGCSISTLRNPYMQGRVLLQEYQRAKDLLGSARKAVFALAGGSMLDEEGNVKSWKEIKADDEAGLKGWFIKPSLDAVERNRINGIVARFKDNYEQAQVEV